MTDTIRIPMSQPDIGKDEFDAVVDILKTGWLSQGKITQKFETSLSNYLSSNVVTVNNGSSALMCALLAHGIKPGDKIIVPDFTFIATSSVAKILGAQIIPVDIDQETLNVSPKNVEEVVSKEDIKAVIVVDVGGLSVDIDVFEELSKKYNFILIEDAAEAIGSEYKNKRIGSFDHTTIFSFHMAKLMTTIEGGCIATKNEIIHEKLKQIKDHGRKINEKYVHDRLGSNFRTTDLQSAIGLKQLGKMPEFIINRNKIAKKYEAELKNLEFQIIPKFSTSHTYMLFFAIAENKIERDKMLVNLIKDGIDARNPWMPIHMQPCNLELHDIKCPNAENIFNRALTLPIYNSMNLEEAQIVIDSINSNNVK